MDSRSFYNYYNDLAGGKPFFAASFLAFPGSRRSPLHFRPADEKYLR